MMPTHIITVQNTMVPGGKEKVQFTAHFSDTDESVIRKAREVYGTRLISVHRVKYEEILTQVF